MLRTIRRLRFSTSIIPTNNPSRTLLSKHLSSTLCDVLKVRPLRFSQIHHLDFSTRAFEPSTVTKAGIHWALAGIVVGEAIANWKQETKEAWKAIFGVSCCKEWIETTNISSCAEDQTKAVEFERAFNGFFIMGVLGLKSYNEKEGGPGSNGKPEKSGDGFEFFTEDGEEDRNIPLTEGKVLLRGQYEELVKGSKLCHWCQESLMKSVDEVVDLIFFKKYGPLAF